MPTMRALALATALAIGALGMGCTDSRHRLHATSDRPAGSGEGVSTYWVEQVVTGLEAPSSIAFLPNGDMLISEQTGELRLVHQAGLREEGVAGVPASFQGSGGGIRDILLDPEFQHNGYIYILLIEGDRERRYPAIYQAHYSESGLTQIRRIFRTKSERYGPGLVGGRMLFLADRTLLIGVPDDRHPDGQDLQSDFGKILRVGRDGSIPDGNPFVGLPNTLPSIWSYGHRMPYGLYQDAHTSEIWEVEPGPRGGDELNLVHAGKNYGWAKASWGFAYNNGGAETPVQSEEGVEDPISVWMPSVTPSGLTRYYGNKYPQWKGDFFVGFLSGQGIGRLRIQNQQVVVQERLLLDLEERIRDVKIGLDDHLYFLTDSGRVLRLRTGFPSPNEASLAARKREIPVSQTPSTDLNEPPAISPDEIANGRDAFVDRCSSCHRISGVVDGPHVGPDLNGIYGRNIGREEGYDYSRTLDGVPSTWNYERLDRFLADPQQYFPGTKMASPPIKDPNTRKEIIAFLMEVSQQ